MTRHTITTNSRPYDKFQITAVPMGNCRKAPHLQMPIEILRALLAYNPDTGVLTWRRRSLALFPNRAIGGTWNTRFAGRVALSTVSTGYARLTINGQKFAAHRVAWAIFHGAWPTGDIDHINRNKTDNRIANLRDVSPAENNRNKTANRRNTSGVTGVDFRKSEKTWRARIACATLGSFSTFEEAVRVRRDAEQRLGFHKDHGHAEVSA